ncbi:hypothetical protein BaRGS_00007732 [Batillaria attramentaria]|uniref:Uncharacterized protein n=1 Tax=Batillaria attramentaria TaxID=370345 RepID=A0ABD0LMP5_9CAEN
MAYEGLAAWDKSRVINSNGVGTHPPDPSFTPWEDRRPPKHKIAFGPTRMTPLPPKVPVWNYERPFAECQSRITIGIERKPTSAGDIASLMPPEEKQYRPKTIQSGSEESGRTLHTDGFCQRTEEAGELFSQATSRTAKQTCTRQ